MLIYGEGGYQNSGLSKVMEVTRINFFSKQKEVTRIQVQLRRRS